MWTLIWTHSSVTSNINHQPTLWLLHLDFTSLKKAPRGVCTLTLTVLNFHNLTVTNTQILCINQGNSQDAATFLSPAVITVPVLNTGTICACSPCGLLESHTAVWYTLSLFLQLRAGDASIGRPQQDVTCAVTDTTSGAGTQTQTPGWPERYFTV